MAPNEQRGKRLPSGQLLLLAQNKINVKGTTFIHIYEYIDGSRAVGRVSLS